jgi:CPA2 family monovalent cation:H+ antiporter-2
MGRPVPASLAADSAAVGRTLAQLDLRGLTGATVLALHRAGGTTIPSADDVLRAGDVLVLAGTADAVAAAGHLMGAAMASDGR